MSTLDTKGFAGNTIFSKKVSLRKVLEQKVGPKKAREPKRQSIRTIARPDRVGPRLLLRIGQDMRAGYALTGPEKGAATILLTKCHFEADLPGD